MIGYSFNYNGLRINDMQEVKDFTNGLREWCISLTNMETDVEIRHTERPYAGNHGIFDSFSYFGKRIFTFEGDIIATSEAQICEAVNELKKAFTLPAVYNYNEDGYRTLSFLCQNGDPVEGFPFTFPVPLFDNESEMGYEVEAKILAPVKITKTFQLSHRRKFFIQLKAHDPRIYSRKQYEIYLLRSWTAEGFKLPLNMDTHSGNVGFVFQSYSSDGITTLNNTGNFSIAPVIRIMGECINPIIKNLTTGAEMKFNLTLAAGEFLDIDVYKQNIVDNNGVNRVSTLDINSQWIWIDTGINEIQFTDDVPSTDLAETKAIIYYRLADV